MFSLFRRRPRGVQPDDLEQETEDYTLSGMERPGLLYYLRRMAGRGEPVTPKENAEIVMHDYRRKATATVPDGPEPPAGCPS